MKASSYRIGEEVMIYGTTSMGMQAVLLAFGIPFLVLLIYFYFISMRLTGGDELRSALVALSALLPYYLIITCMQE